jgi:hypothetical protein
MVGNAEAYKDVRLGPVFSSRKAGNNEQGGAAYYQGKSGDAIGLALDDNRTSGVASYLELPAGGSALASGTVIRGHYCRMLINKAQTADVSIAASNGHLRVKAAMAEGNHNGVWAYLEQSGTVVLTTGYHGALRAKVEGDSGLTANRLHGVLIDYAVASAATVTASNAIDVEANIEGAASIGAWDYLLKAGSASFDTGVFNLPAVASIVATRATPNSTAVCDGYLKCLVENKALLIPLYNACTIA